MVDAKRFHPRFKIFQTTLRFHVRQINMIRQIILLTFLFNVVVVGNGVANYERWKMNPGGTNVCGGAYDGCKMNSDGTYICGGAHDGWKMNPGWTYSVGW